MMTKLPRGEYITLGEYARRHKLTRAGAKYKRENGLLKAYKVGSIYLVKIK